MTGRVEQTDIAWIEDHLMSRADGEIMVTFTCGCWTASEGRWTAGPLGLPPLPRIRAYDCTQGHEDFYDQDAPPQLFEHAASPEARGLVNKRAYDAGYEAAIDDAVRAILDYERGEGRTGSPATLLYATAAIVRGLA